MSNNNITDFIGIKELSIKKVNSTEEKIIVEASLKNFKPKVCSNCGSKHLHYHDKRIQDIKDIPYHKPVIIRFERKRYKCYDCNKKLEIQPQFVQPRKQMTVRLIKRIYVEFKNLRSAREVSNALKVSTTTIFRTIDQILPMRRKLPEVLCIDEFKGDSGSEKYQTSLGDGKNHKLIDILPNRKLEYLKSYFSKIPKEERQKVKIFISDMSKTFKIVHDIYFPQSKYISDKYHFIRQVNWAMENTRKREQKKMNSKDRIYFKRSKSLLSKNVNNLKPHEMSQVTQMLQKNEVIRKAYYIKESFYKYVLKQPNKESAQEALRTWLETVKRYEDPAWRSCITAFNNWEESITNSFDHPYTNGYQEGIHNRIKTIKRVCFGMPNFKHFRTKILLVLN